MSTEHPLVSVVIPTHQRPDYVVQAVESALAQSLRDLEVVVVIDGPDDETALALDAIVDQRLQVRVLPQCVGNAGARNVGIGMARGKWIALLDDDDLWLPGKLELQLQTATRSRYRLPIVSCRLTARNETQSFVWPRLLPEPGQPISEYLFCRRTPATGDGLVQTSTVFAPTDLFRRVGFQVGLARYVDVDWLLRAVRVEGTGVEFVSQRDPLVTWRIESNRRRITTQTNWRWDLDWIRDRRHLVTQRAYGAFVLTLPSVRAAREGDWAALPVLLREAFADGKPGVAEMLYHLGNFLMPYGLRSRLAGLAAAQRPAQSTGADLRRVE